MQKLDKATLTTNIHRAYFHHPYIAKLSCVDIIQFIERFTRFDLYPSEKIVGIKDQREWERLVRNYLEEVHSFIDIQRKVAKGFSKFTGIDVEPIRRSIVDPAPRDSKIIQELRRQVHHESISVIHIGAVGGPGGLFPAIPYILMSEDWFSDKSVKTRVRELMNNPKLLWSLFENHCGHFCNISNAIGNILLEKLGRPPIPPRRKGHPQ